MHGFQYLDNSQALIVNAEKCCSCGSCTIVCPHRILQLEDDQIRRVEPEKCMACGACALNCPTGAIEVQGGEGCGCASYIINQWLARIRGIKSGSCGC